MQTHVIRNRTARFCDIVRAYRVLSKEMLDDPLPEQTDQLLVHVPVIIRYAKHDHSNERD